LQFLPRNNQNRQFTAGICPASIRTNPRVRITLTDLRLVFMLHTRAYESFPRLAAWPLPPGMSNPPPFVPPVVLPGLQEPVNGSFAPPRPNAAHAIGGNTGPYSELVQSPISIQAPIIPQVSPSATPASVQTRPITPPTAATVNAGPVHPGIICDECDKTIVGVRHKCLDCSGSLSLPHTYHPTNYGQQISICVRRA